MKPEGSNYMFLDELIAARAAGNKAKMALLADAAMKDAEKENLLALVNMGIHLRDVEMFDHAEAVLAVVLAKDNTHPFAWYELAISKLLRGAHVEAVLSTERLLTAHPSDTRALTLSAKLHAVLGCHRRAQEMVERLSLLPVDARDILLLSEFCDFVAEFPLGLGRYLAAGLEADQRYLSVERIAAAIDTALSRKEGFSLIRLGDGEGAFISISPYDDVRFPTLYKHNREDRAKVWFNGQIDLEGSGFISLARNLGNILQNADIVGIPYSSWLEHEYRIISMTGISSLVNVLRFVDRSQVRSFRYLCRQTIHIDLWRSGAMERILRSQQEIGLISCHAGLPEIIQKRFDIRNIDFYKIPGEKMHSNIIGDGAVKGIHFPDRYTEIMATFDGSRIDGKLFIVAGGILGKFYCDKIKQCGGVAIDVGSLVDGWIGANTRPGYDQIAF